MAKVIDSYPGSGGTHPKKFFNLSHNTTNQKVGGREIICTVYVYGKLGV